MQTLHTQGVEERVSLKNLPTLRQAFVLASLLIVLGYVLAHFVHPYFIYLPLLPAFGLMLSGLTGFCPMLLILQALPWNNRTN